MQAHPVMRVPAPLATADVVHFVDRHRDALIERVPLVMPIIHDLYQLYRLLTNDEYYRILCTKPEKQMEALFSYVESWSNEDKDKFLQSLREHYIYLVRSLEGN
ncbi:apoptosis-associated speck-like protein containing a CARD isoform X2 [Hyla sarda]|uniref:apoptosis-associated speck-like protein containing a CARD isoform X2 n=1 Tax=Hyla sarda TaxID=327740 RepID=UPI0024C28BE6|nr:apoptosis-associated speck-like protein containing a CARD isoform X2 [Hyla sarda]